MRALNLLFFIFFIGMGLQIGGPFFCCLLALAKTFCNLLNKCCKFAAFGCMFELY